MKKGINCFSPVPLLFSAAPRIGVLIFFACIFFAYKTGVFYVRKKRASKSTAKRASYEKLRKYYCGYLLGFLVTLTYLVFPAGYTIKSYLLIYAMPLLVLLIGLLELRRRDILKIKNKTIYIIAILLISFLGMFVFNYVRENHNEKENNALMNGDQNINQESLMCRDSWNIF